MTTAHLSDQTLAEFTKFTRHDGGLVWFGEGNHPIRLIFEWCAWNCLGIIWELFGRHVFVENHPQISWWLMMTHDERLSFQRLDWCLDHSRNFCRCPAMKMHWIWSWISMTRMMAPQGLAIGPSAPEINDINAGIMGAAETSKQNAWRNPQPWHFTDIHE